MKDAIVDETRKAREEHAAKFNYDLNAIFQDLKQKKIHGGRKPISLPARKTVQGTKKVG